MEYRYKVFISYRRDDAVFKDTVYNILSEYIDEDKIFVDKKDLYNEPNEWAKSLDEALNSSEYIVICINKFTFVREPKDGKTDWYYKEIETALERQKAEGKIRIIPAINVRPEFDQTQFKELSKLQDVAYLSLGQDGFRKNLLKIVGIDVDTAQKKSASASTIIKNISIPENLIPRRDMLDKLDHEFKSHKCVVVSGIGGSGKTSLAYLYIKEQNFSNVAWVIVNGKIEDVFVDRIAGLLFKKEDYEGFTRIDDKQT
ncbi:MAG: toll/interleukin-1 receptor domain-containing protein, partial [Bacteroidales bacterium]|nr:toll/interleukin-1 receptor domain-containing protein [Bacteroidales bacterium]